MVQKEKDSSPTFYRGTNMEVSMPTGSLCSERNVIGTALAADCTLHRHQLKMIAVLSVTLKPSGLNNYSINSQPPLKRFRVNPTSNIPSSSSSSTTATSNNNNNNNNSYSSNSYATTTNSLITNDASTTSTPTLSPVLRTSNLPKHRGDAGINPTSPCGACNEWIRKIAELNPDFKVITFTDETCDEVFINSVH